MTLSGKQLENLENALIDACPNTASLERMLAFELDKNLGAIAGEGSLQEIVFKLIQAANAQGWVEDLVRGACNSNPGNIKLKAIAQELLLNPNPEKSSVPPINNPQKETNQLQKILVLTAIPHGLRLDKEIREIEDAIKRAVKRDSYEIKIRTAVRPQDIRRAIAEEQPSIVHFCGHGEKDGSFVLEDNGGNNKAVFPVGLAALFELHTKYVKCVLLNACYSFKPAEAISQHINYVIGMNQPIQDEAAIVFAQGFYDGLGYDNIDNIDVIQRAFNEGIVAIKLENLLQDAVPSLWENGTLKQPIMEVTPVSHSREVNNFSSNQNRTAPAETPESRQQPAPSDHLSSDCNVDYTKLRNFLKAQQWKEADAETLAVMLKVAGGKTQGWLNVKSIENFPCTDLRTIDQLWIKYTSERFGFSVQKRIWESVGKDKEKFGDCVGWRKGKSWIKYSMVTFKTTAPPGHLPSLVYFGFGLRDVPLWSPLRDFGVVGSGVGCDVGSLASRLVNCNI
jgi:GUN4-like/Effector-associated domain 1/CHAT domain